MNKIRNIIIILILIILIILVSIVLLNLKNNPENNISISEGDVGEVIEITNEIKNVDNIDTFKTVEQCIQKYYNIINNESSLFYGRNDEGEFEKIISDNEIKKMRLNLLSQEYIENKNININNIYQYMNTMEEQGTVIALKMKEIVNVPIEKYLVQAMIIDFNYNVLDEFYIIVNLDVINNTFSIEPILDEYNNIEEIQINNINKEIKSNNENNYKREIYTYEDRAKDYILTYKRLALSQPEILYNYMNEEYRNKRWRTVENFNKYIAENKNDIMKIRFNEYLVNVEENFTQFVCKDQYENYYIFDEILPMQFDLKLDTYTLTTENFIKTYKEANDIERVQLNVDKFVKMINSHDYINIYDYLSEGFKENYFRTESEFEEYIKSIFYRYNKVTYKDVTKKGSDIYIATIQIEDFTGENTEIKEFNIIIQLIDETNFVMSFEI